MIEKYDVLFNEYKEFIKLNSKYNARVVKNNTNTSTYFPIITCKLSNCTNTNNCTLDKIEQYDEYYFTIDIYSKDIVVDKKKISSQVVIDELTKLTIQFFDKKNMYRTACLPTFNIDTSINRQTIQYQCLIGSARFNIIRR